MKRVLLSIITILIGVTTMNAQVVLLSKDSLITAQRNPTMQLEIPEAENKVLLVAITNEYINSQDYNVTNVTLNNKPLIKLAEASSASLTTRNEIEMYYLLDSTLNLINAPQLKDYIELKVEYNNTNLQSLGEVQYHAFFFGSVDQYNPFYDVNTKELLSGSSIAADDEIMLDNHDVLFSVFNSGTEDLTLNTNGGNTILSAQNTDAQTTAFSWMATDEPVEGLANFSTNKTASRLTMIGTAIHSFQGAVLPVELTDIKVRADKEGWAHVTWTTATEKNSDYFIIEKLNNCNNWTVVEEVPGAGASTTEKFYEVVDLIIDPISYYRLTQVDFDGNKQVYDVVSVEVKQEDANDVAISVHPNPASDVAYISGVDPNIPVDIFDMNGNLVKACMPLNPNNCELDITDLQNGVYLVTQGDKSIKLVVKKSMY